MRIINVDPFPSGHLIIDDGSRSLGAKMEDTFGLSLAQQKRRVSGIATYGPQLAEFVDLHESDDARFFYFSKQQRAKLGLVWSFFLEVNRPHWVASSKYLLAKLYGALYSMFLLPWLSKTLIDSVVGTLRWDTALWVSMVAATAYALLLLGLGVAPSSLPPLLTSSPPLLQVRGQAPDGLLLPQSVGRAQAPPALLGAQVPLAVGARPREPPERRRALPPRDHGDGREGDGRQMHTSIHTSTPPIHTSMAH